MAIVTVMVLSLAIPSVMATPPTIEISEPTDDDWFTGYNITFAGNSSMTMQNRTLDRDDLGPGSLVRTAWEDDVLVLRPMRIFHDDFEGTKLNQSNWSFVRSYGKTEVNNSILTITNAIDEGAIRAPTIRSTDITFPKNRNWTAVFRMQFNRDREYLVSTGGGLTVETMTWTGSTMSTYAYSSSSGITHYLTMNRSHTRTFVGDQRWHTYMLSYDATNGWYTGSMDNEYVHSFIPTRDPTFFWFGEQDIDVYSHRMTLRLDYTTVWSFDGSWISTPTKLDGEAIIDTIEPQWSTSNPSTAGLDTWVKVSRDNTTWSEWIRIADGVPARRVEGQYLKFKAEMALPGTMDADANVSLYGYNLTYRYPLERVEVRTNGGEWVNASGLETWTSNVTLVEDDNYLEARVFDSSGQVANATIHVIADTTPPSGTFNISNGSRITNDRNVTLCFNASDKYGVENVLVSYTDLLSDARSFPYTEHLQFEMKAGDGPAELSAWFQDTHGLISRRVEASIIFDSTPPDAELVINGDDEYTSGSLVDLDMEYYDHNGVDHVDLSTSSHFRDPVTVGNDVTTLSFDLDTERDGLHYVYMRVVDTAGNERVVQDSIMVLFPKAVGNLTLNEGSPYTSSPFVMVKVDTPSEYGMTEMQLSTDPLFVGAKWEVYSTSSTWQVSAGDGLKILYARFIDLRGFVTLPINASVFYDATPPELAVVLDGGAVYTTHHTVNVDLVYQDATDPLMMWLSDTDAFDDSDPMPFEGRFEWSLSEDEGPKTLYVMVEDMAGNTASNSSTIHLATISPYIQVTFPTGRYVHEREVVTFSVEWEDPYGDVWVQVSLDSDPGIDAEWLPCDRPVGLPIPMGAQEGEHHIHIRARNVPGIWTDVLRVPLVLDWTAPELEIIEPEDGKKIQKKGSTIPLRVTATDDNGIFNLSYRLDETDWIAFSDLTSMQEDVDVGVYGPHIIEVQAEDRAGNTVILTSTFHLEKEGALEAAGGGMVIVLAVVSMVVLIVAWFAITRMRGSNEED